jgi:O-antigen ligase
MEMLVLFAIVVFRRIHSKFVVVGAVVVLSAVLAVSWIGIQKVFQRFASAQAVDVTMGKRASMRRDTWKIFQDHPVIGTGLGTIQLVFPPYESNYDNKVVNHSHNDYLEALAETGVVGGLCCVWFLGVLFKDSISGLRELESSFGASLNLAGLVGCSGLLMHSLVDFNLHIPANALLFFVSAHLATTRLQTPPPGVSDGASHRRRVRKPEAGRR